MNEHEVYPNAPVVLVALEVRHPTADPLTPTESRAIKKLLSNELPIERPGQQVSVQIMPGAANPAVTTTELFPRYINREATLSVSIRQESIVIEASRYPGWEEFRAFALHALDARMQIAPIVGVERVGIRYVDEIRAPDSDEADWAAWIHQSLLGPNSSSIDLPINQWQGVGIYGSQPGKMLILRYGPREGFAVDPSSALSQAKPADGGPFFLMDVDSFWTPDGPIPEYDRDFLLLTLNDLHTPVRELFEGLITDRLRDEVFRGNA